jgi:hypothetical protein
LWVDTVEKVLGMAAQRNNRIIESDFLNRSCAFESFLELILLGDPPENLFSTASVMQRLREGIRRIAALPRIADSMSTMMAWLVRANCCREQMQQYAVRSQDLFDHLVSAAAQREWHTKAERPGSLQIGSLVARGRNS